MKKLLPAAAVMPGMAAVFFSKPLKGILQVIPFLFLLLIANQTYGTVPCSSEAVTANGHTVKFIGVTYSQGPGGCQSTWTYEVTGDESTNAISHIVFGNEACLACLNDDDDILDATVSGIGNPSTAVGEDGSTPFCGIKFDDGWDKGETRTLTFTMNGAYAVGTILFVAKAGSGYTTAEICGPVCAAPTCENGSWNEATCGCEQQQCTIGVTGIKADIACHGDNNGSIDITVSGAQGNVTYLWSDGSTDEDRSGLAPGLYAVTVTDDEGCTSGDAFLITEPFALGLSGNVINVTITNGSDGIIDITVTGGTFPYSFLWSDGSTDEDRTNLPAGIYSVTITDFNGCQYTQVFTEDEPECTIGVTGNTIDVTCNGNNDGSIDITVSGAQGAVTYLWSDGSTDEDRTNLAPGSYSVTVTDEGSCTSGETFGITEPAALDIAEIVISETSVDGANGSIDITVTGGTPPYSFLWSDGSTDEDRINLTPGNYSVTVTDGHECSSGDTYEIEEYICTLTVDALPDADKCKGDDLMLSAVSSDQNATFSWSPQTGLDNPNIANPVTSVKNNTTYTVTVTGADGCTASDDVTVTINPVVKAKITVLANDAGCAEPCVKLSTPYDAAWAYKWKFNGQNAPAPNTSNTYCACASGVYSVKVTDTNTGCKHNSKKYTVTISQKMEAGQTITEDAAIHFSAWPNPTSDVLNVTIHNLSEGATTVRLVDMFGRVIATEDAGAEGQTITFNMNDLASGVYFVRMESGNFKEVQKILLAK